jgi:hypothetical protein
LRSRWPYRIDSCPRSRSSLEEIQAEILTLVEGGDLRHRGVGFSVDPRRCSVHVIGELTDGAIELLADRFGSSVTIRDGVPVVPLDGEADV